MLRKMDVACRQDYFWPLLSNIYQGGSGGGGGTDIVEPNPRDRRSVVKKKQNSWHFLSKIVGAKLRKTQ